MTSLAHLLGSPEQNHPLRTQFMKWQCRVRQIAMREGQGQPGDAITPEVTVTGETEPLGAVITIMSKSLLHSKTPEMQHLFKQTNDPAQRRQKALEFFSENYFQKANEFSDALTATFAPNSTGAEKLTQAGQCSLFFDAFGHQFTLLCDVSDLGQGDPLYQATWWHNALFNPALPPDTQILAFSPDWEKSRPEI